MSPSISTTRSRKDKKDDLRAAVLAAAKSPDPRRALRALSKKHPPVSVLRVLGSLQDGQFATAQAGSLGLTPSAIQWLATSLETVRVRKRVWRFRSAHGDPNPAVTAFLRCWPGGVVSHDDAAHQHRLRARPDSRHITVAHGHAIRPSEITIHISRNLPNSDRFWRGAVPYTSLARTVCDLADPRTPWAVFTMVDNAIAQGAKQAWLHQRASELTKGRAGVTLVREVTDPGSAAIFRSWLERTSAHVYVVSHLPPPEWNVEVRDGAGRIGIVDALCLVRHGSRDPSSP
jgi:hypothetical protein